jgi:hypothetical protein
MGSNRSQIPERRNFVRVVYGSGQGPWLTLDDRVFEIADMNQGGLRFITAFEPKIRGTVSGTVEFRDGKSVRIQGHIEWHQDNQSGMSFNALIPESVIQSEQRQAILRGD